MKQLELRCFQVDFAHSHSDLVLLFSSLQAKELPTFKDNDFLNEGHKLQIGDDNKKYFLEKLKRDVEVGSDPTSLWTQQS